MSRALFTLAEPVANPSSRDGLALLALVPHPVISTIQKGS